MRRDNRVSSMGEMLNCFKKNYIIEENVEDTFKNQFNPSLPFTLFQNDISKIKNQANPRSYSEEIREFCSTLHVYCPRAYDFIRLRSITRSIHNS